MWPRWMFGQPQPLDQAKQYNPPLQNWPPQDGRYKEVVTTLFSRGSSRYGFAGPVLERNPIGAGQVHMAYIRPERRAGQKTGALILFGSPQLGMNVPVGLLGLMTPAQLAVILPGPYRDAVVESIQVGPGVAPNLTTSS